MPYFQTPGETGLFRCHHRGDSLILVRGQSSPGPPPGAVPSTRRLTDLRRARTAWLPKISGRPSAANLALVEWSDNIGISNDPPERYWPDQVAGKNIGYDRRSKQEEWHALPHGWTSMGYEDFLSARRRLMAQVTHEGFKRLTDPNYVPDLTRPAAEPTAAELALPSLAALVSSGMLPAGTCVTALDAEGELAGEIMEDGQLKIGEHAYSSPDRAAHEHRSDSGDGWSYWLAHLGGDPISLAALGEAAKPLEQAST